jgi:regulatory protein
VTHDLESSDVVKPKASKATGFQLSLKGRALRLLSLREHSRQELERKLKPFEQTPGELAQALDFLEAKDFLNEQRVVESVVNSRSRKLGASRVRQELQAKGLPAEAIAQAVQDMRSTELERAREVWRKKFGQPPADPAARAKQVRFLVSRGFAPEVVKRVVAGADEF